jgi:hypothetical protein
MPGTAQHRRTISASVSALLATTFLAIECRAQIHEIETTYLRSPYSEMRLKGLKQLRDELSSSTPLKHGGNDTSSRAPDQ